MQTVPVLSGRSTYAASDRLVLQALKILFDYDLWQSSAQPVASLSSTHAGGLLTYAKVVLHLPAFEKYPGTHHNCVPVMRSLVSLSPFSILQNGLAETCATRFRQDQRNEVRYLQADALHILLPAHQEMTPMSVLTLPAPHLAHLLKVEHKQRPLEASFRENLRSCRSNPEEMCSHHFQQHVAGQRIDH